MAELKTKATDASVAKFLKGIKDEDARADCEALAKLMRRATGSKPRMWGPSIVGFGSYHYKYASGREGDWFLAGFSPRKQSLTLYCMGGLDADLMKKLGRHKVGGSCLYIKRLADVDVPTLEKLVAKSVSTAKKRNARS
jgi:hypothetical protein